MDKKYLEILNGAMQMFGRIGIRSVSIDDIAQQLHIINILRIRKI